MRGLAGTYISLGRQKKMGFIFLRQPEDSGLLQTSVETRPSFTMMKAGRQKEKSSFAYSFLFLALMEQPDGFQEFR